MEISAFLTRDNIETAGVVVSIVAGASALWNSRRMNQIADQSMANAKISAQAAEASAVATKEMVDLQREQWIDSRSALLHIDPGNQVLPIDTGGMVFIGFEVEIINRGNADAIELWRTWEAREGDTWIQLDRRFFHSLKAGDMFSTKADISSKQYEHYSGFRLTLDYTDYAVHVDEFIFEKEPQSMESLRFTSAIQDGHPHPANPRVYS